jgi:hypothetical protein
MREKEKIVMGEEKTGNPSQMSEYSVSGFLRTPL